MSDEAPVRFEEPSAAAAAAADATSAADDPDDPGNSGGDDPIEASVDDLPEQMQIRRAKYDRLMADPQRAPFPVGVPRTHSLAQIRASYLDLPADTRTGVEVGITGRVIFARNTGKLCFATLREDGVELQVMLSAAEVGPEQLEAWKGDVDLGDQVFVSGEVITSRRGELSVSAREWRMTAKALRPLPVAYRPLSEETRVRQRYVDLIVRPDARRMVTARAGILRSVRRTLDARGYIEVETPILNVLHGGAAARPFRTHLNAFDLDMTLRIATELYLKRAVIGGIDRVYELGRTFRNEGVDSSHSPEFTELEAYEAYGDYDTMAELTRAIVVDAARYLGLEEFSGPDGQPIDLFGPWRSIPLFDAVSDAVGTALGPDTPVADLEQLAGSHGVPVRPGSSAGDVVLELYEKLVEHTLIQPTFIRDYPADVRPLARPHRDDPRLTEAWDLVIGGVELGVAYSELADPVEQRRRLTEQSIAAAGGDPEAMELDEDFLRALEYGLPPTGGMGLGIDRLIMLLTSRWGIRETILFPLLKPLPGGS